MFWFLVWGLHLSVVYATEVIDLSQEVMSPKAVSVRWVRSEAPEKQKKVILLGTILSGSDKYTSVLVNAATQKGFDCVVVGNGNFIEIFKKIKSSADLTLLKEKYDEQIKLNESVLKWIKQNPQYRDHQVVVFGISFGGIMLSLLMAQNPQDVYQGFFVVSGAGIHDLILNSNEKNIKAARQRIYKSYGENERIGKKMLRRDLEALGELSEVMSIEEVLPKDFEKRVFIISGYFDEVIPSKNTRQLWKKMGKPKNNEFLFAGHRTMFARSEKLKEKALRFFLTD